MLAYNSGAADDAPAEPEMLLAGHAEWTQPLYVLTVATPLHCAVRAQGTEKQWQFAVSGRGYIILLLKWRHEPFMCLPDGCMCDELRGSD